jgi:hypothetical protein
LGCSVPKDARAGGIATFCKYRSRLQNADAAPAAASAGDGLTTVLSSTTSDYTFAVMNVYAPSDHRDSATFLEDLKEVVGNVHDSWVLLGDFNLTLCEEENSNGVVNPSLADAFSNTINTLGHQDLPLLDRMFTWSNHRAPPLLQVQGRT